MPRLTLRQKKLVDHLINLGKWNDPRIARHFSVATTTIRMRRQFLKRPPVLGRNTKIPRKLWPAIAKEYESGSSVFALAKKYGKEYGGVSPSAISRILWSQGVNRSASEAGILRHANLPGSDARRISAIKVAFARMPLKSLFETFQSVDLRIQGMSESLALKQKLPPQFFDELRGLLLQREALFELLPPELQIKIEEQAKENTPVDNYINLAARIFRGRKRSAK